MRLRGRTGERLRSPADFAECASGGRWLNRPHLDLVSEGIKQAAERPRRLIIVSPPRHGKSQLCSQYAPAWFLLTHPHKRVILASYAAGFAATWGRRARRLVEQHGPAHGVLVDPGSKASDRWDIAGGEGGMLTAGVGGGITGRGADLFIIDDPVKNQKEANSQRYRDAVWEWWQSVAYTRLEPDASVVVIMTRWHEDDLVGRLLQHASEEEEDWEVMVFPALAEPGDCLGRTPGQALWPERYSEARLNAIRVNVGAYYWSALYQGNPAPAEGGLFHREQFRYYDQHRDGEELVYRLYGGDGRHQDVSASRCRRFQTVDLAASTKDSADFTVIATFAVTPKNDLLVLNVMRRRLTGPEQLERLRQEYDLHLPATIHIESSAYQLTAVQHAVGAGLPARELKADRDKYSRALTASARYEAGTVYHRAGAHWLPGLEGELLSFPYGEHDDQVDAVAYAAIVIAEKRHDILPARAGSDALHLAGLGRRQF